MSDDKKPGGPVVPVGGGVPFDPETGKRFGYLPRKAAKRKLVIRAELGLPWVLGALAAALLVLVAGVLFLRSRPGRPNPPYADAGPLSYYAEGDVTPLRDQSLAPVGAGWLDRRSGLAVFTADGLAYCPADGGWVDGSGRRYDRDGRAESGAGLARLPVVAASGHVFVDPTRADPVAGAAEPLPPCPDPRSVDEPPPADGL